MAYPDKNPLDRLDMIPPFLAHALALESNGKKRLPLEIIIARSGLAQRTYLRTARKTSWDSVKVGVMRRFFLGCSVNPFRMRNKFRYLREHDYQMPYLTKKQWQIFNQLCAEQKRKQAAPTP